MVPYIWSLDAYFALIGFCYVYFVLLDSYYSQNGRTTKNETKKALFGVNR